MAKKQSKKISEMLASNIKEIATGITSEKLSAQFFDATKLKYQPEPLYRLDIGDNRWYYRFENDAPIFYTSVTTLIKNTLPTNPGLIKWLADRGSEEGHAEAMSRAFYGTQLHTYCAELLINGKFNLDDLPAKLEASAKKEKMEIQSDWIDEIKKDVLSFAQFAIDFQVEPLAIEQVLYHPKDGYAGAIDLVCFLNYEEKGNFGEVYASGTNKGQPKESKRIRRICALIDIKSGRKSFYESHQLQLRAYKFMWNYHFPDCPVERVFNFSPKDYRGIIPSYNFKDQTECDSAEKLPFLVELAKIEDKKKDKKLLITRGTIDLTKGLANNLCEKTFIELVKNDK